VLLVGGLGWSLGATGSATGALFGRVGKSEASVQDLTTAARIDVSSSMRPPTTGASRTR
jgi:hypothetical protein